MPRGRPPKHAKIDINQRRTITAGYAFDCLDRLFKNPTPGQNDVLAGKEAREFLKFVIPELQATKHVGIKEMLDEYKKAKDNIDVGIMPAVRA